MHPLHLKGEKNQKMILTKNRNVYDGKTGWQPRSNGLPDVMDSIPDKLFLPWISVF